MTKPIFGETTTGSPQGYAKNLVYSILRELPHLKEDMDGLMEEVSRRKNYEVKRDSVTRYARSFPN